MAASRGKGRNHSYFNGCSNGGRQAPTEAQRYPADYDGIIAGASANFMTHLFSTGVWDNQVLAVNYLPPSKLPAIEAAALGSVRRSGWRGGWGNRRSAEMPLRPIEPALPGC